MALTTSRPMRTSSLRGLGDGPLLDFSKLNLATLPTSSTGAIDWGAMALPPQPDFGVLTAPKVASGSDFADLAKEIVNGAQTFFGAQAAITNAQTEAQLARARGQAAVAITKAGGSNAARTAGAGLPSPTLLLFAALGLGAIVILKK